MKVDFNEHFLIPLKKIYLHEPKLQTFRAQFVLHGQQSNSHISRYITQLGGVGGFVSDSNSLLIALAVLEQTVPPIKEISKRAYLYFTDCKQWALEHSLKRKYITTQVEIYEPLKYIL